MHDTSPTTIADVLIVDDNPVNLDLLAEMLAKRRYGVRLANSGRRALAAAQTQPPDLVMLDINMPQMDGYEVCRQLKADARTRDVPVIFLSALDEVVDKVKAFEVGGADYVAKPFEFGEVLVRTENQLKIARLQRHLAERNQELARRNDDLARKNAELRRAQEREALAFSALAEALPGTVLDGRFRLEDKIGEGGFGAVYRARQLALDRPVAVKVLHPLLGGSGELARFLQEGVAACRLNHENAVAVIDSGLSAGVAYLVMELLQGWSLAAEIQERGRLPPARSLEVAEPVCRVLAEAHAVGLIHRDIKPANIFLHRTREREVVKVVDFGISKLVRGEEAPSSRLVGTPHYLAPERVTGNAHDGRSDVYSLGVTLYQMLSGVLPLAVESLSEWLAAVNGPTLPVQPLQQRCPELPPALCEVVMRTLARDAASRPTAQELEGLLAAARR